MRVAIDPSRGCDRCEALRGRQQALPAATEPTNATVLAAAPVIPNGWARTISCTFKSHGAAPPTGPEWRGS
ncbi:hypothetical protein J4G37_23015 [Microvirga sp. 3-52]|nr:hypothetical protein [Microvirga sp. 3-52]